ncbi:hypothetical protein E2562_037177 [Oryza meyeriana var. granulata]|uniref:Uncharacterized protein n=1 Tax=Oryza meyeriana var. granulata TaxID=110450 RepID=A0A6G1DAW4_9ORYZ|nr:hypothetical protein E2562_037177 [Oryza meyeriana var. granulata]
MAAIRKADDGSESNGRIQNWRMGWIGEAWSRWGGNDRSGAAAFDQPAFKLPALTAAARPELWCVREEIRRRRIWIWCQSCSGYGGCGTSRAVNLTQ